MLLMIRKSHFFGKKNGGMLLKLSNVPLSSKPFFSSILFLKVKLLKSFGWYPWHPCTPLATRPLNEKLWRVRHSKPWLSAVVCYQVFGLRDNNSAIYHNHCTNKEPGDGGEALKLESWSRCNLTISDDPFGERLFFLAKYI